MPLKYIKAEDLVSALGITVENADSITLDDIKTQIDSKFVLRDNVLKDDDIHKKIMGKTLGSITTKAAQIFGITAGELKDKQLVDILELAKSKTDLTITELTEKASQGDDKKVAELQKQLGQLEAQKKLAEDGVKQWEEKFNTETGQWETKLKAYKLNDKVSKIKETLKDKFVDDFHSDELKRTGFEARINQLYDFDIDEKDTPIVKLKSTGELVKSKKTIGHAATLDEIFLSEMEATGVLKKNNAQPKKIISTFVEGNGKDNVKPINAKAAERIAQITGK